MPTPPATDPLAEVPDLLTVGDKITYLNLLKFQLGTERTYETGVVLDVVSGDASKVQMIFSQPDNAMNRESLVRTDYYLPGADQNVIKKVRQEPR